MKELGGGILREILLVHAAFSHTCIPHSLYPEVFLYCLHLTFIEFIQIIQTEWQEGRVNLYPYILLYILGSYTLRPPHLQVPSFDIQLNHTYIDKHGRAGTINLTFCNKHPLPLHRML